MKPNLQLRRQPLAIAARSFRRSLHKLSVSVGPALIVAGLAGTQAVFAFPAPIQLPFSDGETWYVCQGYHGPGSHQNDLALDMSTDPNASSGGTGCSPSTSNVSTGHAVFAPGNGTAFLVNSDLICINFIAGGSALIGYMVNRVANGSSVHGGDQIGTVEPPDPNSPNGNYAHIHLQAYVSFDCGSAPQVDFSDVNGTHLACAPNMPNNGSVNQYRGQPLTRCPVSIPGDLDHNNSVNIFDYNTLVANFGRSNCDNTADIDGNCSVDIFDYNILVSNFGVQS